MFSILHPKRGYWQSGQYVPNLKDATKYGLADTAWAVITLRNIKGGTVVNNDHPVTIDKKEWLRQQPSVNASDLT